MALVQATVTNIEIHCAIGTQDYISDGYFPLGYTQHTFTADRFEVGVVTAPTTSSLTVTATEIQAADVSLGIVSQIGDQDYFDTETYVEASYFVSSFDAFITTNVDADVSIPITMVIGSQDYLADDDYVPQNFFNNTFDANVETVASEAILSATSSITVLGTELRQATVNIDGDVLVGERYVVADYTEQGYFQEGVTAQNQAFATVDPSAAATSSVLANADFVGDVNITATLTVTPSAGFTADGEVTLSSQATVTAVPFEIQAVDAALDIALGTTLVANAELAGEVSVSISTTSSIQANAESTGIINPDIFSSLTVNCQVFRDNPRYTLIIPQETRVNTITEETRTVKIPKETRELEFFV